MKKKNLQEGKLEDEDRFYQFIWIPHSSYFRMALVALRWLHTVMGVKHLQVFVESACLNHTKNSVSVGGKDETEGQVAGT